MNERIPQPEMYAHIDRLNFAFDEALPKLLDQTPHIITVKGYKPEPKDEHEVSKFIQLRSRILHKLPRLSQVADMDFSVTVEPLMTDYDFLNIHLNNGWDLHYHKTSKGFSQYIAHKPGEQKNIALSNIALLKPVDFAHILTAYNLPLSLNMKGSLIYGIDSILSDLNSADVTQVEQRQTTAVYPHTLVDVQSVSSYITRAGTDEKDISRQVAVNLFRADGANAEHSSTAIFAIDQQGNGHFSALYDKPLQTSELADQNLIAAAKTSPSVEQLLHIQTVISNTLYS